MKKVNKVIVLITLILAALVLALTLALAGCNNYFHDIIPPDENRITSFSVEGMIGRAAITDNEVDALVDNESPIAALIPRIGVSSKATLLPLTYEYLSAAFPSADILEESAAVYRAGDLSEHVLDLIKRNPDFNVPPLDTPIDFTGPVSFLVVSGRGTIRQYTIHVVKDTGEPKILGFGFSKYDNPELVRDSSTAINQTAKTVNAAVLYPMEMTVSYALKPSFEIFGDRLEIDGVEIESGVDEIQFAQALGAQVKTLTVWRNGVSADYALTADFSEDPDSIRSIVDFRFYKAANPGIAATAVGSIVNNNALGTISVQVFYSGTQPSALTPAFLSPGTVSVAGVTQVSSSNSHDFSQTIEYRVVSRNNLYTRVYTVVVDYIDVASAAPVFTSFKFSSGLNHELVQDTESQISDSAGLIMITARYGGSYPPEMLIPEFRATGLVTVFGSVQTSGFSAQNFSIQVKYTVTNPENPLFKRDYWVQVTFIRDTSSAASINSFSFHPDENPGLADELIGRIDQVAGTIVIYAPVGSGITGRTMIPHFRATGQVLVDGSVQISGTSGHLFNAPVVYEAVSANGANRKSYTVTVRELQSTIFVNQHALLGHNDGTSWADAFRDLKDACEAAALFSDDVPKEIWIAAGTYKPSTTDSEKYFPLAANTFYVGGFAGHETAKSERNVAANKTIISGYDDDTAAAVNGDLSFENLEFTGTGIRAELSGNYELRITDCDFNNFQASGAVCLSNGKLVISSTNFEDITCGTSPGAVYGADLSGVEIDGIKLHGLTGNGLYFSGCSEDVEMSDIDLQDITGDGLYFANCQGNITMSDVNLQDIIGDGISITGGSGRREFSGITRNMSMGGCGVLVAGGSGDIILTDSNFDSGSCAVAFDSGGFPVRITGTTVKNISGGDAIFANGGNTVIENVVVEDVTSGAAGMKIVYNGTFRVSGSTIRNMNGSNFGLHLSGSGNAIISNTTIENIEVDNSAISANITGDLTIIDSAINAINAFRGLDLTGSGNTVISNNTINNITAGSSDSGSYAIYVSGRRLVIEDTTMDNITGMYGVYGTGLTGVGISDLALQSVGYGFYFENCNGDMEINNVDLEGISNYGIYILNSSGNIAINDVDLQNISDTGINISGSNGNKEFSNITGYNIKGSYSVRVSGSGNITLVESKFDSVGQVNLYANYASVNISDTEIKNVYSSYAIYTYSYLGNIAIERVSVENVPNGIGIFMFGSSNTSSGKITDSIIKNCKGTFNGAGIVMQISGVISNTIIEDVEAPSGSPAIEATGAEVTIRETTIRNAKTTGASGAILYSGTGSGKLVISETTIENVERSSNGGAIDLIRGVPSGGVPSAYFTQVNISNTTIKNSKSYAGGGISSRGSCPVSLVISDTTIENVEATTGGAIYSIYSSDLTITNSTIKNAKASNGGAIFYSGSGNVTISGTTIEDVETTDTAPIGSGFGGGIYVGANTSQFNLSNTTIKNAKARSGGGLYYLADKPFVITGSPDTPRSRFENCKADDQYGAIYLAYANVLPEVTNTTFLNCTARNGYKFIRNEVQRTYRGCTFEDNNALYIYDAPTVGLVYPMFGYDTKAVFENCTFNNLRSNQANGNFIFTTLNQFYDETYFTGATTMDAKWQANLNITLRNCTFNFGAGSAGLCALYGGSGGPGDYLLMDGVTITNNGGQTPLVWLDRASAPSALQVNISNPNNLYNGTPLSTLMTMVIMGTDTSGVIKLTNGATPSLAP